MAPTRSILVVRHAGADVGRIVAVLKAAGSAYLAPLLALREAVEGEAALARDSLRLLSCLQEPCKRADAGTPSVRPAPTSEAYHDRDLVESCVSACALRLTHICSGCVS